MTRSPHARVWSRPAVGLARPDRLLPTRGDGPAVSLKKDGASGCSPYARGWSQRRAAAALPPHLLPARAWMVQHAEHVDDQRCLFPAPSGGPIKIVLAQLGRLSLYPWGVRETNADYMEERTCCSPRPRGCSHGHATDEADAALFPVPAGMVLRYRLRGVGRSTAPCTFGGPVCVVVNGTLANCSLHVRGWSQRLGGRRQLQRLLPPTGGDVPTACARFDPSSNCSPHPRGCSRPLPHLRAARGLPPRVRGCSPAPGQCLCRRQLLPASAEVFPRAGTSSAGDGLASRTRGVFPDRRGSRRIAAATPRTRGDGPASDSSVHWRMSCSPRPRGWSHRPRSGQRSRPLLPARDGTVPTAP
jgi:hypothetical protein